MLGALTIMLGALTIMLGALTIKQRSEISFFAIAIQKSTTDLIINAALFAFVGSMFDDVLYICCYISAQMYRMGRRCAPIN